MVYGSKMRTGKVKPREEIGLTFPHQTFAVFTFCGNIRDS